MSSWQETATQLKTRLDWRRVKLSRFLSGWTAKLQSWPRVELLKQITFVRVGVLILFVLIGWFAYTEAVRPKRYEDLVTRASVQQTIGRLNTDLHRGSARVSRVISSWGMKFRAWLWTEILKQITLVRVGVLILLVLIGWYVRTEAVRPVIFIDWIAVPKRYEDIGLTSSIMSMRVTEKLHQIEKGIENAARHDRFLHAADYNLPDIQVPAAKLSLKAVVQLAQQVFHHEPIHIRGEIAFVWDCSSASNTYQPVDIWYHIYYGSRFRSAENEQLQTARPEEVIQHYSEGLLKRINPYLWAAYLGWTKHNLFGAIKAAEDIIRNTDDNSNEGRRLLSMSYSLIGDALAALEQPAEAIEKYKKAVELDPTYIEAHNGWGRTLYSLQQPAEAIEKYKKAVELRSQVR